MTPSEIPASTALTAPRAAPQASVVASEKRLVHAPFGWVGAPWLKTGKLLKLLKKAKLPGVRFVAKTYTPTKSVFKGKKSRGIRMIITDRNKLKPLDVFAHLVTALRDTHPKKFEIRPKRMTLMTGTPEFARLYLEKAGPEEILKIFKSHSTKFATERAAFLLY